MPHTPSMRNRCGKHWLLPGSSLSQPHSRWKYAKNTWNKVGTVAILAEPVSAAPLLETTWSYSEIESSKSIVPVLVQEIWHERIIQDWDNGSNAYLKNSNLQYLQVQQLTQACQGCVKLISTKRLSGSQKISFDDSLTQMFCLSGLPKPHQGVTALMASFSTQTLLIHLKNLTRKHSWRAMQVWWVPIHCCL
jgi:hypothetical protein